MVKLVYGAKRNLLCSIRDTKISNILNQLGRMSVTFFLISRRAQKVDKLTLAQLAQLKRYIPNVPCGQRGGF